jgi:hypothetical protein
MPEIPAAYRLSTGNNEIVPLPSLYLLQLVLSPG